MNARDPVPAEPFVSFVGERMHLLCASRAAVAALMAGEPEHLVPATAVLTQAVLWCRERGAMWSATRAELPPSLPVEARRQGRKREMRPPPELPLRTPLGITAQWRKAMHRRPIDPGGP